MGAERCGDVRSRIPLMAMMTTMMRRRKRKMRMLCGCYADADNSMRVSDQKRFVFSFPGIQWMQARAPYNFFCVYQIVTRCYKYESNGTPLATCGEQTASKKNLE